MTTPATVTLFLAFSEVLLGGAVGKFSDYGAIDVNDILSPDYMPGSLLLLENLDNDQEGFDNVTSRGARLDEDFSTENGSFSAAFFTMGYHRKMMNEYLCRSYISSQILSDISASRIKRRLGSPAITQSARLKNAIRNNLLEDEGSSTYKDWLKKSATLEDIYRHYEEPNELQDRNTIEIDMDNIKDDNQEFDGHITGFAYESPHGTHQQSPAKSSHSGGGGGYQYTGLGAHATTGGGGGGGASYGFGGGSGSGHTSYGGGGGGGTPVSPGGMHYGGISGHATYEEPHEPEKHQIYVEKHHHYVKHGDRSGKEGLSELFEIAMTAIALLSFKLFVLHVIMCLCATSTTTTTAATMMPMSMSPTGETGGGNGNGEMDTTPAATGGTGDGGNGGTGGGNGGTGNGNGDGGEGGDGNGGTDGGDGNGGTGGDDGNGGTGGGDGNGGTGGGDGDGGTGGGDGNGGTDGGDGNGGTGGGDGNGGTGGGDGNGGGGGTSTGGGDNGGGGTTGTGTATGTGTGGTGDGGGTAEGLRDELVFRQRRQVETLVQPNNQMLNEMARKVLVSIEAALVANKDDGVCLQRVLCENNKDARVDDNQKYWIPAWSLGMSWVSGRLIKSVPSTTSMLNNLKASILGLGNADCELLYSGCNLAGERDKRRKRRKKRSTAK